MKNIILVVLVFISFCSCSITSRMGTRVAHSGKPYVQTNDSTITAVTVKEKGNKLIVDGEAIPLYTVRAYCNGRDSFLRCGNSFARKIQNGNIDIYAKAYVSNTSYYYGGGSSGNSSHIHTSFYVKPASSAQLLLMSYKNVSGVIKKDEPAYKYILQYDQKRRINKILFYSSLASIVGGIVLVNVSGNPEGGLATVGSVVALSGFTGSVVCMFRRGTKEKSLARAIALHNGMLAH